MRIALVTAIVVLVAAAGEVAGAARAAERSLSATHVRGLSTQARELLELAVARSPVIATFLEDLERSNVVVYVELPGESKSDYPVSHLTFVTCHDGTRYLLVRIDAWRTVPLERIALLGHELYHALEVAQAAEVRDVTTLRALYRRIGHEAGGGDRFETEPARIAGERVRADVSRPR